MDPPSRLLEQGDRQPSAKELAGDIDVQGPAPILRAHLLHWRRRAGNAGIVDQHVQAAQMNCQVAEDSLHVGGNGHVGLGEAHLRKLLE